MADDPTRAHYGLKRGSTVRGTWPSAVLENFYECASGDPKALEVWCYTDRLSYAPGDQVRFHVSTTAARYTLEIYRDGWTTVPVYRAEGLAGRFHPTPEDCSVGGCNWPVSHELEIPADWKSGGYVIRTSASDPDGTEIEHYHLFIVRSASPGENANILFIASTSTWIAYNDWGGSNHYEGITGPNRDQYSPVVSTQRPFSRGFVWLPPGAPRIPLQSPPPIGAPPRYPHMEWAYANGFSKKYASAGWASYDRHFLRWAEQNGFAVDVITQHDLHSAPQQLDAYRCVVFVGHDEYWTWEMRDAIDRYVESGGRVARFAGNFTWQIRLEDEGRQQVCYKYRATKEDPVRDTDRRHLLTTHWDAAVLGRPGAKTFGLNASQGVYAGWGLCCPRSSGAFTVYRPEHWAFDGTDLYYGDELGREAKVFGYEVDGLDYIIREGLPYPTYRDGAIEGTEILAMGLATLMEENHGHPESAFFIGDGDLQTKAELLYDDATGPGMASLGRGSGMIVYFERGKGAVFHAGTCEWVSGLIHRDPYVERVTSNVLSRFLAQRSGR